MALKHFDIISGISVPLSQYSENRIAIKKIKLIEGDSGDLFYAIKITTTLPSGEVYQYNINPISFHSVKKRDDNDTNLPMDIVIRYCKFTEILRVPNAHAKDKRIVLRIYYTTSEIAALKIIVNQDLEGYTFILPPASQELILSKFNNVRPVRSVSVGYSVKENLQNYYGKIEDYILPALTDLSKKQLDDLGEIELIEPNGKLIKTL